MGLSREELDTLIQKLRGRYDEYAKKFSPKWFNRNSFEERYHLAMFNKMDIEAFILAEVANFEKIRERYEKKKSEKFSFTAKVDSIIEENYAKIKRYQAINFHPRAGLEMKHMYGALSELAQAYMPALWIVFNDYQRRNAITQLEHRFQRVAVQKGSRPPAAIEDHILLLNREDVSDIEIEKARNNYLKESAFLLYDIINFCEGFFSERISDLDLPLRFDKAFFTPEVKQVIIKRFSECTGYGALLKIKEQAEQILTDFRLTAFKPAR